MVYITVREIWPRGTGLERRVNIVVQTRDKTRGHSFDLTTRGLKRYKRLAQIHLLLAHKNNWRLEPYTVTPGYTLIRGR